MKKKVMMTVTTMMCLVSYNDDLLNVYFLNFKNN